jgi:hypothetical protein
MVQSRPPEASATGVLTGIGIARNAPQQVHISRYLYPDIVSSINNHGAIARPLSTIRIRSRWRTSQSSRRAHIHHTLYAVRPRAFPFAPLDVPLLQEEATPPLATWLCTDSRRVLAKSPRSELLLLVALLLLLLLAFLLRGLGQPILERHWWRVGSSCCGLGAVRRLGGCLGRGWRRIRRGRRRG